MSGLHLEPSRGPLPFWEPKLGIGETPTAIAVIATNAYGMVVDHDGRPPFPINRIGVVVVTPNGGSFELIHARPASPQSTTLNEVSRSAVTAAGSANTLQELAVTENMLLQGDVLIFHPSVATVTVRGASAYATVTAVQFKTVFKSGTTSPLAMPTTVVYNPANIIWMLARKV